MKLTHAKFYQGVKLGGDTFASISVGQNVRSSEENIKAEMEQVQNGILIRYGKKATLATWNNIQYALYEDEAQAPAKKNLEAALARK